MKGKKEVEKRQSDEIKTPMRIRGVTVERCKEVITTIKLGTRSETGHGGQRE